MWERTLRACDSMADYVCTRMEVTQSADVPDFAFSADPPIRSRRVVVLRLVRTALSGLVWFAIVVVLLGVGAAAGSTAVWATDAKVPPQVAAFLRRTGVAMPVRAVQVEPAPVKSGLYDRALVTGIYDRASPSIVEITTSRGERRGSGSGVLISPNGTVLTNYHVVRDATSIEVTLLDHTRLVATMLGRDPQDDIAFLRLEDAPPSLQTLTLGDSDELRPGELAIAIGNPIGLDRSISVGVISGLGRTLRDGDRPMRHIIQTDATLNPGNSGGALLNAAGEVIGITNAIERAAGRAGFGGIGYAVPSSSVKRFADRLLAGEHIRHAWLGISGQDVTPSAARELGVTVSRGVAIGSVVGVGPAARAGLRKGDVITAVDRAPVETMDAFGAYLDRTYRPGDRVTLTISRGSETIETMATLEPWPEGDMAP